MHILVVPSWYPSADNPINGSFFAEQAKALSRYGHRVTVIAYEKDSDGRTYTEERTAGENMKEYILHYQPLRFHLTYFRIVRGMLRIVRSLPQSERPDIIHVHSFRAVKYARALKSRFRIPVVVTEHATWFERKMLSEKQLQSIRRDFSHADGMIAVSEGLKRTIGPYCDKPVSVIPNMVASSFFQSELHRPRDGEFRFISVSSMDRKKGVDVLLRAFRQLLDDGYKAHLTICGQGVDQDEFHALSEELGLSDKVIFTGQVSREECAERLRDSQAFVLPSRAETFGVVYVEAMAKGLPIIMTKTNAWEMLAKPETGLAVDIEDVPGLTEAMKRVMDHYGDYDPDVIAAFCREHFSEQAICEQITAKYKEVLAGK